MLEDISINVIFKNEKRTANNPAFSSKHFLPMAYRIGIKRNPKINEINLAEKTRSSKK